MQPFRMRKPTAGDIPALAALHVEAWNQTYPGFPTPPGYELRLTQWRQAFASHDGWFGFVVEDPAGKLIGFAKGQRYNHADLPDFSGELNKIYVLREYHRRGIGRGLVGHVARGFLRRGIHSMVLFSDPSNPAGRFFETLGAERILANSGEFDGTYAWRDLNRLAARCPAE